MYTLTIENGWINIQDTVLNSKQAIEVHGLHLANREDHVKLIGAGSSIMLFPSLIDTINGAVIDGETVDDIIAIIQTAAILPTGGTSLEFVTITASSGNSLSSASLVGKTAHIVFFNGISSSTGFNLVGSTITFSDGTTFNNGDTVKILIS